jgi:hypothetical protein
MLLNCSKYDLIITKKKINTNEKVNTSIMFDLYNKLCRRI